MGNYKPRDSADHATVEEVEAAIAGLTDADLLRLERFATYRSRSLLALGLGWSGEDLLQEALMRTVGAIRKWKRGVSLVKHIIETMRSISSHLPDELKGNRPMAIESDCSDEECSRAILATDRASPEEIVGTSAILTGIKERVSDDYEVSLLFEALGDGMSGPEIREALGWSQNNLETVTKRLRRAVNREEEWRP